MSQIRVAVVDDHAVVREGIRRVLEGEPGVTVVGEGANGDEALRLVAKEKPDVLVMDVAMPGKSGLQVAADLHRQGSATKVLMLSMYDQPEYVLESVKSGARGYLLKDSPSSEIAGRIVELFEGGSPISPSVARSVIRRFVKPAAGPHEPHDNPLSQRELEVLRLIEKGMTYEEVAQVLALSWHTVTAYLRRVYRKLQVHSRGEAVFEARQRGIL